MRIIDLLQVLDAGVTPEQTKVHLACWDGHDEPLDVYIAGNFADWQSRQTRQNFSRKFVLSLIALPQADHWLFAGVHESQGCNPSGDGEFRYCLTELQCCIELNGRLVAHFKRPGRQSYLNAERWVEQILLAHILPERMVMAPFPGYKSVSLSRSELEVIVRQNLESWRTALSSVAGVYLISDTISGRLYVGSATGEGGLWQRWCEYAKGHGGNRELKALFTEHGADRAQALRFAVLEIADTHASVEEILKRESHWKTVLLSRPHGLNAN
jgi:hypothetical protein